MMEYGAELDNWKLGKNKKSLKKIEKVQKVVWSKTIMG